MQRLTRSPYAFHIARAAVFAAMVALAVVTAACSGEGPESGPGQVDSERNNSMALSSAPDDPDSAFGVQFYCKDANSPISLERYLIGAQRENGLPSPSSPEYQASLPPLCIVSPMGGVPPYTATAAIDGRPMRRVTTGTTELTFAMPPMQPGAHTVTYNVTDTKGNEGHGSTEVTFDWDNESKAQMRFTQPGVQLTESEPGDEVAFEVDYEVFEPSERPQLGIESFLSQTYTVTWDFGDGTTETYEVDERTGDLTAAHVYDEEGLYTTAVSIVGNSFGQVGDASVRFDIRPAGSVRIESGEVIQQWRLVETRHNPAGAPVRTREVDRVFEDDSLNKYVEKTVSLSELAIAVGVVKGKGNDESFIGNYDVSVLETPGVLTAGETASFSIEGEVVNVLGSDSEGETVRLSGLPGQDDLTLQLSSDMPSGSIEASFNVPTPTSTGQTLVITLSFDGAEAGVIQWVYQYG